MSLSTWEPKYSVNVMLLDSQHQELIKIISLLEKAVQHDDIEHDGINRVLDGLESYCQKHFTVEEEIMRIYEYPEFEDHKKTHQQFINKVQEIKESFSHKESIDQNKVLEYLNNWVLVHIMVQDKKYSSFLNEKGLS